MTEYIEVTETRWMPLPEHPDKTCMYHQYRNAYAYEATQKAYFCRGCYNQIEENFKKQYKNKKGQYKPYKLGETKR